MDRYVPGRASRRACESDWNSARNRQCSGSAPRVAEWRFPARNASARNGGLGNKTPRTRRGVSQKLPESNPFEVLGRPQLRFDQRSRPLTIACSTKSHSERHPVGEYRDNQPIPHWPAHRHPANQVGEEVEDVLDADAVDGVEIGAGVAGEPSTQEVEYVVDGEGAGAVEVGRAGSPRAVPLLTLFQGKGITVRQT
jgi:hypothetical protein